MSHSICDLSHHHGEADNQEEDPNEAAADLPAVVGRSPQAGYVDLCQQVTIWLAAAAAAGSSR